MVAITATTGIGSGLDINAIVDELVAAEGDARKATLDVNEADALARITAFGNLKSSLTEFETALGNLDSLSDFQKRNATSADETLFTATADNTASTGSYNIEVVNLAQAHKVRSADFVSQNSIIGTGTLNIQVGTKQATLNVITGEHTLAGIRDSINENAATLGVTATIVNLDSGSRLLITANETGASNTITISVTGDGDGNDSDNAGLSQLISANLVQVDAAEDAQITIDGATVTNSSNVIEDAIDGVTLTLLQESPSGATGLSVSKDSTAAINAVSAFVDAYNGVIDTINSLTDFVAAGSDSNGILIGDSTLRSIETGLRDVINTVVSSVGSNNVNILAEIGITTDQNNGKLKLSTSKLLNELNSNFDAVGNLFASSTDGVAIVLKDLVGQYIASDGIINTRTQGLNTAVKGISDQRIRLELRLEKFEATVLAQFIAMEKIVAGLKSEGDFLLQALESLPAANNNNNN